MPTSPGVTTVGLTTAHNCIAKPVSHCSSGADRLALPYSISNGQWRDTEVAWQGFPRDSSRQAQVSPPWGERPPACLSASQRGLGFSGAHWKTLLHSFQSNCEQDGGGGLKHSIQIEYPSRKLKIPFYKDTVHCAQLRGNIHSKHSQYDPIFLLLS